MIRLVFCLFRLVKVPFWLLSFVFVKKVTLSDERGDGDSFWVSDRNGRKIHLRLKGMDSPEYSQPLGREAGRHRVELLKGLELRVRRCGRDCYGRTLAKVEVPEIGDLGRAMVAEGFAYSTGGYPFAQFKARIGKKGVWALARRDRKKPWSYRNS